MEKQTLETLVNEQLGWLNRGAAKGPMNRLLPLLADDEVVRLVALGKRDGKDWLVAATDRRLVIISGGLLGARHDAFPYDRITAVSHEAGLTNHRLRVSLASQMIEIEQIRPPTQAAELVSFIRDQLAGSPRAEAPIMGQAVQPAPDRVAQLERLADLHDRGVLSDAEFQAEKRRLLDQ